MLFDTFARGADTRNLDDEGVLGRVVVLDTAVGALIAGAAVILAAIVGVGGAYLTRRAFPREVVLEVAQARFESRLEAYGALLPLLDFGPEWEPISLNEEARRARIVAIRAWFYDGKHGGGLLLGGEAHRAYVDLLGALRTSGVGETEVRERASLLRTHLKTDLHIRQPTERDIPLSPSHEHTEWKN